MNESLTRNNIDVAANLAAIQARMDKAASEAGRAATDVTLIAVSKFHGADRIVPALAAGQRIFGENRVQEAADKWPSLREGYDDIKLHLIGPLQSNKVRQAVSLFDAIETIDRPKLARRIADAIEALARAPELFIQINIGEEPQKAGIAPREADAFIARCRDEFGLTIAGLMCIPPQGEAPAPYFMLLEKIAKRNGLAKLSMGMSEDFETAIAFGATHIRVGTAIFGARD
ncbi:MAG TPA: YggS family pyridoxal phosphate-dependent enzyme [Alphaproteobacteria bacterium]|nr:YggS family pyridoxal phosphate-dependent enzyme [Alphaproteobacteria bacterium]HBA41497.1 YggS family pyridoxal phosphate-dependent enzyme [Alphaproteobacteria bacterium]HBC55364.1 YggS family pyridoxal phosphate-dependent enzyme [Alphaproteobacteria bacterium]HBF99166.1 YggS family pyridoxal phosphate-dependent enzyme [Alphaproteobacteria bacterium]HCO89896.1 YggS family pyridoxal phosphate-dependent enzyme [Alphaproteobacteria bacterium]